MRATIDSHDVTTAERLVTKLFSYMGRAKAFTMEPNSVNMVKLLIRANHKGLVWKDDVVHNWGLKYDLPKMYGTIDHQYWGIHKALVGDLDEIIFPQRPLLSAKIRKDAKANSNGYRRATVHPSVREDVTLWKAN